jgi:hypothetical protein
MADVCGLRLIGPRLKYDVSLLAVVGCVTFSQNKAPARRSSTSSLAKHNGTTATQPVGICFVKSSSQKEEIHP